MVIATSEGGFGAGAIGKAYSAGGSSGVQQTFTRSVGVVM